MAIRRARHGRTKTRGDRRAAAQGLSAAKIVAPDAADVVRRPRLFRHLDRQQSRPLTWISGPAGSGKTTLVTSYLHERRLRAAWYRVDETDEDVATLFFYLTQACPAGRRPLPLYTPE